MTVREDWRVALDAASTLVRRWTAEEDAAIREYHGRASNSAIAKVLGRCRESVRERAIALGVWNARR